MGTRSISDRTTLHAATKLAPLAICKNDETTNPINTIAIVSSEAAFPTRSYSCNASSQIVFSSLPSPRYKTQARGFRALRKPTYEHFLAVSRRNFYAAMSNEDPILGERRREAPDINGRRQAGGRPAVSRGRNPSFAIPKIRSPSFMQREKDEEIPDANSTPWGVEPTAEEKAKEEAATAADRAIQARLTRKVSQAMAATTEAGSTIMSQTSQLKKSVSRFAIAPSKAMNSCNDAPAPVKIAVSSAGGGVSAGVCDEKSSAATNTREDVAGGAPAPSRFAPSSSGVSSSCAVPTVPSMFTAIPAASAHAGPATRTNATPVAHLAASQPSSSYARVVPVPSAATVRASVAPSSARTAPLPAPSSPRGATCGDFSDNESDDHVQVESYDFEDAKEDEDKSPGGIQQGRFDNIDTKVKKPSRTDIKMHDSGANSGGLESKTSDQVSKKVVEVSDVGQVDSKNKIFQSKKKVVAESDSSKDSPAKDTKSKQASGHKERESDDKNGEGGGSSSTLKASKSKVKIIRSKVKTKSDGADSGGLGGRTKSRKMTFGEKLRMALSRGSAAVGEGETSGTDSDDEAKDAKDEAKRGKRKTGKSEASETEAEAVATSDDDCDGDNKDNDHLDEDDDIDVKEASAVRSLMADDYISYQTKGKAEKGAWRKNKAVK
jgi:hypothetical protein